MPVTFYLDQISYTYAIVIVTIATLQTLADSLIIGFSSVPILSQNYRFSSAQFSIRYSPVPDSVSETAFQNILGQIGSKSVQF